MAFDSWILVKLRMVRAVRDDQDSGAWPVIFGLSEISILDRRERVLQDVGRVPVMLFAAIESHRKLIRADSELGSDPLM